MPTSIPEYNNRNPKARDHVQSIMLCSPRNCRYSYKLKIEFVLLVSIGVIQYQAPGASTERIRHVTVCLVTLYHA